ncbi:MAG TPA: hypothetical protein VEU33_15870 [Archangium sp.]|nr:hypothetical protein [Archangium sp.]
MSQHLREKATAILDVASTPRKEGAPPPCPACGMVMSLPESSAHLVAPPVR